MFPFGHRGADGRHSRDSGGVVGHQAPHNAPGDVDAAEESSAARAASGRRSEHRLSAENRCRCRCRRRRAGIVQHGRSVHRAKGCARRRHARRARRAYRPNKARHDDLRGVRLQRVERPAELVVNRLSGKTYVVVSVAAKQLHCLELRRGTANGARHRLRQRLMQCQRQMPKARQAGQQPGQVRVAKVARRYGEVVPPVRGCPVRAKLPRAELQRFKSRQATQCVELGLADVAKAMVQSGEVAQVWCARRRRRRHVVDELQEQRRRLLCAGIFL